MNGGARFLTTWLNNSIEIESKILTPKGSYIIELVDTALLHVAGRYASFAVLLSP